MKSAVHDQLTDLASGWHTKRTEFVQDLDEYNQGVSVKLHAQKLKKSNVADQADQVMSEAKEQIKSTTEQQGRLEARLKEITGGVDSQVKSYGDQLKDDYARDLDEMYTDGNRTRDRLMDVAADLMSASDSYNDYMSEHLDQSNHTDMLAKVQQFRSSHDANDVAFVDSWSKALDLKRLQLRKWLVAFYDQDRRFDEAARSKFRDLGEELDENVHGAMNSLKENVTGLRAQEGQLQLVFKHKLQNVNTEVQDEVLKLYYESNHAIDRVMMNSQMNAEVKRLIVSRMQASKEAMATTLLNQEGTIEERRIALANELARMEELTQDALKMGNKVLLKHALGHDLSKLASAQNSAEDNVNQFNRNVEKISANAQNMPTSLAQLRVGSPHQSSLNDLSAQKDPVITDVLMADADTELEKKIAQFYPSTMA